MTIKISLIHATRGRPEKTIEVRRTWFARAADPGKVEHIWGIDADDADTLAATEGEPRVIVGNPKGCFRAYNSAALFSTGDLIIPIEDDLWPELSWDAQIREVMSDFINEVAVLAVSDGQNQCIEWAWTRKFYEARKPLYHDDYFGLFGDTEWRERARQDHILTIMAPHIKLDHRQFQPGTGHDPIYERKQALYLADELTFNQRGRAGWPA